MTAPKEKLVPLGPWPKGINNRADETTLASDELRAAVNVDLTTRGNPHTRRGRTKLISGQSMHSFWAHKQFPYALAIDNNALKAYSIDFDPALTVSIRSGLKPAQPLSYAEVNGDVYWSNGFDQGRITATLGDLPFGLAPPTGSPTLAVVAGEALPAGQYQVACTFMTTDGEESGSTLAAVIDVPESGGITVSHIPQPTDSRVYLVRIYVTPPNGDVLYWYRDLPVNITTCTIGNIVTQGKMLETQWLSPLPPGHIVRYYNGMLLVASDNVLWHGVALRYGQTRRSENHIAYDKRISLLEPVGQAQQGGFFIASGKRTYYIQAANLKKDVQRVIAHPFGAVPGTGLSVPGWYFDPALNSECAFWMDAEGRAILGLPGGSIRVLAGDRYVAPIAESGSSLFRDIDGIRSVICNLRGTATNKAAATDEFVATVHRNGVVV